MTLKTLNVTKNVIGNGLWAIYHLLLGLMLRV